MVPTNLESVIRGARILIAMFQDDGRVLRLCCYADETCSLMRSRSQRPRDELASSGALLMNSESLVALMKIPYKRGFDDAARDSMFLSGHCPRYLRYPYHIPFKLSFRRAIKSSKLTRTLHKSCRRLPRQPQPEPRWFLPQSLDSAEQQHRCQLHKYSWSSIKKADFRRSIARF